METLPLELSNAIDRELASLVPNKLREACFELTQRYTQGDHMETHLHRQAYMAARLPATYGVTRQVFRRIESQLDSVTTLLDLGAGLGSLAWAAADAMPNLHHITLVEKDVEMLRMGQELTQSNLDPLEIAWCRDNIAEALSFPPHEVVTLSYVLNELSRQEQAHVVHKAFEAADQFLILIEPGTPKGYSNILMARTLLINHGGHIVAPCPHQAPCPLAPAFQEGKDWCHFRVRIPRGKYHRRAKEATLPYEDEKYSYLVISKHDHPPKGDRIIKAPILKTGHVILDLCTRSGEEERRIVSKSEGELYSQARDCDWGDEWSVNSNQ
jgi:ribosomal protein RSM22 (predicted rRNA methylase)